MSGLNGWYLAGYQDTLVTFDAGTLEPRPGLTYTQTYYLASALPARCLIIQLGSGLLNGDAL